jgi:hypothetical protein
MNTPAQIHDEAMNLANTAFGLQREGNLDAAHKFFLRACELEARAANQIENLPENEPSRSMLYLGAASLAFNAKKFILAEQYIDQARMGTPPDHIACDLRQLLEDIRNVTGKNEQ